MLGQGTHAFWLRPSTRVHALVNGLSQLVENRFDRPSAPRGAVLERSFGWGPPPAGAPRALRAIPARPAGLRSTGEGSGVRCRRLPSDWGTAPRAAPRTPERGRPAPSRSRGTIPRP